MCEGSGNATVDYTTGLLTFSEATKVSVAGVDEHTGQELWSRDITGEDWTAMDGRLSRPVDSSVEVLQQRGESVLVTPETGKRLTGGEGLPDGYTCFSSRPYDSDGEQIIRSDFLFFACNASGDIQAPPTARALDALLVDTPHDVDIVTDPHGISRFP